eukprot:jgi/Tetstr1/447357/TSEL_034794.t1
MPTPTEQALAKAADAVADANRRLPTQGTRLRFEWAGVVPCPAFRLRLVDSDALRGGATPGDVVFIDTSLRTDPAAFWSHFRDARKRCLVLFGLDRDVRTCSINRLYDTAQTSLSSSATKRALGDFFASKKGLRFRDLSNDTYSSPDPAPDSSPDPVPSLHDEFCAWLASPGDRDQNTFWLTWIHPRNRPVTNQDLEYAGYFRDRTVKCTAKELFHCMMGLAFSDHTCPVCYEDPDQLTSNFACPHMFCRTCLGKMDRCPLCRSGAVRPASGGPANRPRR